MEWDWDLSMKEMTTLTYTYDAHRYFFDVKLPAIIAVLAALASVVMFVMQVLVPIAVLLLIVSCYTFFNTLVAHAYPEEVSLDERELVLRSFGRTDTFRLADIARLQLRENGATYSAYIRINGGGLTRGRYFVNCKDLRDTRGGQADELYQFFLDTEARLDPDNLRVRSRKLAAQAASEPAEKPRSRRHNRKK